MQFLGHTLKNYSLFILNSNLTGHLLLLFAKSGNPTFILLFAKSGNPTFILYINTKTKKHNHQDSHILDSFPNPLIQLELIWVLPNQIIN